jgi:hypothetical protein
MVVHINPPLPTVVTFETVEFTIETEEDLESIKIAAPTTTDILSTFKKLKMLPFALLCTREPICPSLKHHQIFEIIL